MRTPMAAINAVATPMYMAIFFFDTGSCLTLDTNTRATPTVSIV